MNKILSRIIVGAIVGIVFFSILLILIERTSLVWTAYIWALWAIIVFAISMGYWAKSDKNNYFLQSAYPLIVKNYMIWTIVIAILFVFFEKAEIITIKFGWFCLIEFVVLAIYTWKMQAIDTAREEISHIDEQVKLQTISWKMLAAELAAIYEKADSLDTTAVNALLVVVESIRYADPMEHNAVSDIVEKISIKIQELSQAVEANEIEKIKELCSSIDRLVKERANKLMILK